MSDRTLRLRPRLKPAAAGTVPLGHVKRDWRGLDGATRRSTRRRAANFRYGDRLPAARTLRQAAATVTRWSRSPALASLSPKARGLSGRTASSLSPSPALEAPALSAKYPRGQETETAFVAPAGTVMAWKTVRLATTCEVAEATTTRAAAANAAMSHLPMPQYLRGNRNTTWA